MPKKNVPSLVKDEQLIEQRREQMVKGAVSLFIKKGFHRTTTREIAKESGFSIGTLYEYIGSKEDVLYLVFDSVYEEVRLRIEEHLETAGSGLARLKQVIRSMLIVMDDMQDKVLVTYQEAKSLPKDALPYVLEKERSVTVTIENVIKTCCKDDLLPLSEREVWLMAHNIMVASQMWVFRRWAIQKECTLEEYADLQIQLLLSGVGEGKLEA